MARRFVKPFERENGPREKNGARNPLSERRAPSLWQHHFSWRLSFASLTTDGAKEVLRVV